MDKYNNIHEKNNLDDLSFFEKEFIKKYYNNLDYDGTIHELPKENLKVTIYEDCKRECQNLSYIFNIREDNCTKVVMDDSENFSKIYDSLAETFINNGQLEIARFLIQTRNKTLVSLDKELQYGLKLYYHRYQWKNFEKNIFLEFLVVNRVARQITYDIRRKNNELIGKFKYPNELVEISQDFVKILLSSYENYSDFDSLYDDAIEFIKERRRMYSQMPLPESSKGKWMRIGSDSFSFKEYLINYFQLSNIYKYAWKKNYSLLYLLLGDYYVFVDHMGIPKIYIILENGKIIEINKKDKNLNKIKIEDEYRDEFNSFLENYNNWLDNTKISAEIEKQKKLTNTFIE